MNKSHFKDSTHLNISLNCARHKVWPAGIEKSSSVLKVLKGKDIRRESSFPCRFSLSGEMCKNGIIPMILKYKIYFSFRNNLNKI